MIGTTVSHYKILEKIGGGGMGIVYKAQDLKLDRAVALKFLPPELTLDPDAKERFIHEAKAASSLQHHNICTIHDVDQTADGQMFIVMDLYEGETLKSRIAKGKLRIEEATDIAIQIAQGLAEAHEHGIIHRDIKPANVLITKNGVAKIVDFGLAKLSGATKVTKTGSTLGTVAYMAPEQLQGSDVDARADIFSLGVVLYEMLTGKTPFRGDHEAALMYSIMNEEPEPLQHFIADVPSELIHIVSRALEKSPADRYKTMDDLLIDLRRLRKETSKVSMPGFTGVVQHRFMWKHAALLGLGVIIVAALVIVFILPSPRKMPQPNRDAKTQVIPTPMNTWGYPCLSSDGNWMAFIREDSNGKRDVYFMNTSGGDVRRITDDSSDYQEVGDISRDGAWLACTRLVNHKAEVALVPSQGGKSQTVCAGLWPRWTVDNQRLMYVNSPRGWGRGTKSGRYEIWSVRRDGTDNHFEFIGPGIYGNVMAMSLSPDSKSVAWIETFPDYSNDIITHNLETGSESQITFTKSIMDEVFWTANNFIIYSSDRSKNFDLWMCPADGGESIPITLSSSAKLRAQLSADGRKLLYYEYQLVGNIKTLNLENGTVSAITSDDLNRTGLSICPDNQRFAFMPTNAYSNLLTTHGIHVIDRRRVESPLSVVSGVRTGDQTAWSPDGQWIAFTRRPDSVTQPYKICVISPTSPASMKVVGEGEQDLTGLASGTYVRWVDNGTLLWFTPGQKKTWVSSIEHPNPRQFYNDSTRAYPLQGRRYVLFRDYRHGHEGWWVDLSPAVTNAGSRSVKKILGPEEVSIAPDGRFLLFMTSKGELQKVSLPEGKVYSLAYRLQNVIADFGSEGIGAISSDGKQLAYVEHVQTGKLVLVENPFIWK